MSSYRPPNPRFTSTAGYYTGAGQAPSQFADTYAKTYGTYGQGLASMGNSYANSFGSYMGGLANLATQQANERGARASAAAQAEAARQLASGNIGSAALGAYGGAANSAFDAWKGNQQSYNQSVGLMHQANQSGLSNYGISRNQALGQLGDAYGNIGKAQVGANALANLNISGMFGGGGGGGGGFSASGPDGQIASGSYGGMGGGGGSGFSMTGSRSSSSGGGGGGSALEGLAGLRKNLMSRDLPEDMLGEARRGREQLDMQHYSSRNMPSQMLNQTLGGLVGLGNQAYGASGRGMDQFYANQRNEASYNPYRALAAQMESGYGTVGRQIGGTQRDLTSGFGTANQNVGDLWRDSWGTTDLFGSPATKARMAREAEILTRGYAREDAELTARRAAMEAQQREEMYNAKLAAGWLPTRERFIPRSAGSSWGTTVREQVPASEASDYVMEAWRSRAARAAREAAVAGMPDTYGRPIY